MVSNTPAPSHRRTGELPRYVVTGGYAIVIPAAIGFATVGSWHGSVGIAVLLTALVGVLILCGGGGE